MLFRSLRQRMTGQGGHGISLATGGQALNSPTLRYCPLCVQDDRQTYGETYWHRLPQVAAVRVCPYHDCWLEDSNVPTVSGNAKRGQFIATDTLLPTELVIRPLSDSPDERVHLRLAQAVALLLAHPLPARELCEIREQYQARIANLGYGSMNGKLHSQKVLTAFQGHFSPEILQNLGCTLEDDVNRNWLTAHLLREHRQTTPTVRHLLLLQFLEVSPHRFIHETVVVKPFGDGMFPCLNKICPDYQQQVIPDAEIIGFQLGKPEGAFTCPTCGFCYKRVGPDTDVENWQRAQKILAYGHLWEARLHRLVHTPNVQLKDITETLQISKKIAKRELQVRGYSLPARVKASAVAPGQHGQVDVDTLQDCRVRWQKVQQRYPDWGRSQLRQHDAFAYYYLQKFDRDWFEQHSPAIARRGSPAFDWQALDADIAPQIASLAQEIQAQLPWVQVTASALSQRLGYRPNYLTRHLENLPQTALALQAVCESHLDFALRKLRDIMQQPIGQGMTQTELLKAAHIKRLRHHPDVQALLNTTN